MSLLASPIHSFVYLYILLCLHLLSLSIHLSIFIYVLCLHFLSFSLYICLSLHPFMFTLVVFFSMHLYIFIYVSCVHFLSFSLHPFVHLMLTLVFLSPSICCPFEKMKSRSVDERSCPFLSKIKITQNMFLEQKTFWPNLEECLCARDATQTIDPNLDRGKRHHTMWIVLCMHLCWMELLFVKTKI